MNKEIKDDSNKIEIVRLVENEGFSQSEVARIMGIPRTTISDFLLRKTFKSFWEKYDDKPVASGTYFDQHHNIRKGMTNRYILTSAQNNTYVHGNFLKSLEQMAEHIDAQIIVGTCSYNTGGFQNLEKGEGDWFDPKIKDFIIDEPMQLAKDLIWCGELNILPTAVNPISGLHSYTKSSSGILPHAKVQLESVATGKNEPTKFMYTTGSVTKKNYIQKKEGQKAAFHHIFGALVVEVDEDGDWFVRQLICDSDSGSFQDLTTIYSPDGYEEDYSVAAINWGDIHVEKLNAAVAEASFYGADSMLEYLAPEYQFIHDVLDFSARNHHNIKDPYFRFMMYHNKTEIVEDNIDAVVDFLASINSGADKTIIVESNHDLAFKKWLKESDYKTDPANAIFFLENQLRMYHAMADGDKLFSPFEHVVRMKLGGVFDGIKFLRTDESYIICGDNGIECGNHGHLGANGARGTIQTYQRTGRRANIGHSHSAFIKDGVYQAGTSSELDLGYNEGSSSWSNSHIVTYSNGKRTIVTIKNGKWRA